MKKIFIYYSLSGNGEVISQYLKNNNIDLRKVITAEPLPKNRILSILTGGFRAFINYEDKLIDFDDDISSYDEIIIGSPIWNGRLSSPINSVLKKIKLEDKKIIFILYSGSGKNNKATEILAKKYSNCTIINLKEPKRNENEMKEKLSNIK